jgi:hypothetical protein
VAADVDEPNHHQGRPLGSCVLITRHKRDIAHGSDILEVDLWNLVTFRKKYGINEMEILKCIAVGVDAFGDEREVRQALDPASYE